MHSQKAFDRLKYCTSLTYSTVQLIKIEMAGTNKKSAFIMHVQNGRIKTKNLKLVVILLSCIKQNGSISVNPVFKISIFDINISLILVYDMNISKFSSKSTDSMEIGQIIYNTPTWLICILNLSLRTILTTKSAYWQHIVAATEANIKFGNSRNDIGNIV